MLVTFVLVHGSWHGGWCWRFVSPLLRAKGHEVHTPTLSGLGANSHMIGCNIDLGTHIQDITNLLFYEDLSDVTLVGHSYGGMVITGVAAKSPERLARLIYLDAFVPAPGQKEFDLVPPELRAGLRGDLAIGKGFRPSLPLSYFGVTEPNFAAWVAARLSQQPLAAYDQPAPTTNSKSVALPRAYIHCTAGPSTRIFAPFAAKARAEGWIVRELPTGHDAMLTMPKELSGMLLEMVL